MKKQLFPFWSGSKQEDCESQLEAALEVIQTGEFLIADLQGSDVSPWEAEIDPTLLGDGLKR